MAAMIALIASRPSAIQNGAHPPLTINIAVKLGTGDLQLGRQE